VAGVCQSNDDLNFEKCSFDSYHTRNACINTEGGGGGRHPFSTFFDSCCLNFSFDNF
jgi:hypothetical protein